MPHRIHLRGPWQYEWVSGSPAPNPPAGTVRLPSDWRSRFGPVAGRVRLRRRFHRPTNLAAEDRVLLVLSNLGDESAIQLNGQMLAPTLASYDALSFDITPFLETTNELLIEMRVGSSATAQPRVPFAGAVFEIHGTADE